MVWTRDPIDSDMVGPSHLFPLTDKVVSLSVQLSHVFCLSRHILYGHTKISPRSCNKLTIFRSRSSKVYFEEAYLANHGPNWDGLLKWSLSHSDGASPSRRLSEEDRQWFMEAMQGHTIDSISRMKQISQIMKMPEQLLESQGVTSEDLEGMLDELQDHVESIDLANDLHSIGGLVPLISYLKNSTAKIRAKAADVLTRVVQNNPRSQQLVMEAKGFEPLLTNFISDPDIRVRTKALGAISSLIRHNQQGVTAFRLANGYAGLRDALVSGTVRFQRKALNLIHYLLQESNSDCRIVRHLGFPRIMIHLASNQDLEVREFALRGLLALAREESERNLDRADVNLRQLLEERTRRIIAMSVEDLCAAREERELVDILWTVCYNEPSHLRERGLVYLPCDDEMAPDVIRDRFEPPLRAWAARRHDETSEPPVPLLLGPARSSHYHGVCSDHKGKKIGVLTTNFKCFIHSPL